MEIVVYKIRVIKSDRVKAVFSFVIEDELAIHDVKLVNLNGKCFLAMPCQKYKDCWRDVVHPIGPRLRKQMEAVAIEAYQKAMQAELAESQPETWPVFNKTMEELTDV